LKLKVQVSGIHAALSANNLSSMRYILKLIQKNNTPLSKINDALLIELRFEPEKYILCKSELDKWKSQLDKRDLQNATTPVTRTPQTRRI
jgi:hypothetical protein